MHALMQNGDNTNGTIGQDTPIDIMMLIPAIEAFDAESPGDIPPGNAAFGNIFKASKKAANITVSLILSPLLACIVVNVIYPAAGGALHAITDHEA